MANRWLAGRNHAVTSAIVSEFQERCSRETRQQLAMLTVADRAMYFHAGLNYGFDGAIVDGGCFLGGTTTALAEGLLRNPQINEHIEITPGLIRAYDMFRVEGEGVIGLLPIARPGETFVEGESFRHVYEASIARFAPLVQIREGDVAEIGYQDEMDIAVLGVDFCKAPHITDSVVRSFFPRLRPNALVIQQDFTHEWQPHIQIAMMRLRDHFELYADFAGGGSVAFANTRPITAELIEQRFGPDGSWYAEIDTNVALLRQLIDETLYDQNRPFHLEALAFYYANHGLGSEALATLAERSALHPGPVAVEAWVREAFPELS